MNIDFNNWWDEDDLTTQGNPFTDGTAAYWAWEGWCAAVKAEREVCAKLAEQADNCMNDPYENVHAREIAAAIRARSNT